MLISYETYRTCVFFFCFFFLGGGEGSDHVAPSGSAHWLEISNCPLPRHGLLYSVGGGCFISIETYRCCDFSGGESGL